MLLCTDWAISRPARRASLIRRSNSLIVWRFFGRGGSSPAVRSETGRGIREVPPDSGRGVSRPSVAASRAIAPGLALAVGIALVAYGISQVEPRASALVAALLLGMVVSNVVGGRAMLAPGARFAARKVLRVGIALLGLRISLDLIGDVGWRGVLVAVAAVGVTLPFSVWFGRRLGVSPALSLLIGAGCGICGAAAVVAMEPIAEAKDEEAGFALATVTALGTIAMLACPCSGRARSGCPTTTSACGPAAACTRWPRWSARPAACRPPRSPSPPS